MLVPIAINLPVQGLMRVMERDYGMGRQTNAPGQFHLHLEKRPIYKIVILIPYKTQCFRNTIFQIGRFRNHSILPLMIITCDFCKAIGTVI